MKKIKILAIIIAIPFLFYLLLHFGSLELGSWRGESIEKYRDKVYQGNIRFDIPEAALNFRFSGSNYGLSAYSSAAFTLTEKDYDDYMNYISELSPGKITTKNKYEFVGKKAYETYDYYDSSAVQKIYEGFPKRNYKYIINDSIDNYLILYYDYSNSSSTNIDAILANPETHRIVIYHGGCN